MFSSCRFRASYKMYVVNMYFLLKYCLLFSSSKSGILSRGITNKKVNNKKAYECSEKKISVIPNN